LAIITLQIAAKAKMVISFAVLHAIGPRTAQINMNEKCHLPKQTRCLQFNIKKRQQQTTNTLSQTPKQNKDDNG